MAHVYHPLRPPDIRTYVLYMTHHWRASDHLEPSYRAGEWRMYDRGYFIGYIQYGRINGTPGLRGMTPEGRLLGYERELEGACDRMWEWYIRTRYQNTG
jgi:hypothetical protein